MNEKNVMYNKVKFYWERSIIVHISIINSGVFYNGRIISHDDHSLILMDNKLGECYLQFEEIKEVQPFKEVEK